MHLALCDEGATHVVEVVEGIEVPDEPLQLEVGDLVVVVEELARPMAHATGHHCRGLLAMMRRLELGLLRLAM